MTVRYFPRGAMSASVTIGALGTAPEGYGILWCRGLRVPGRAGPLDAQALAKQIVDVASDKQASDIVLLDIRPISVIADYFVVCSAASDRQINAVVRDVTETLRNNFGVRPLRVEGDAASGWVLMDYGDVIVHIFGAGQRDFYKIEELWSAAVPLVRVQ